MEQKDLHLFVARIEALERRLWGGEPPGGSCVSEAELLRVLDQAGRRFFVGRAANGEPPPELTEAVNAVIAGRSRGDGRQPLLSIRHAALVQLIENLFRYLEYSRDLDPDAFAALRGLQICMAKAAVADVAALSSTTRPVRQFLQLSLLACQGCDQHAGSRSQALLTRIEQAVREILASPLPPEQACHSSLREFAGFLQQYERESLAMAQDCVDEEQARALQERWRRTIQAEAFGVLAGKRLPQAALEFFDRVWSAYLLEISQWEGADGRAWEEGVKAVHSLVESLSIRDPEQMLACYGDLLTEALPVFRRGAEKTDPDSPLIHDFLEQMEAFCLQVLQGEEPDPSQMIDVPGDAYDLDGAEVTDAAELARIDSMGEGLWYRLRSRGVEKRGKLIHKNSEDLYCLFVNYSGIKTARLDFRRVAEGLKSGTVEPVDMETVYQRALDYAVERMAEYLPHLQSKVEETEAERERLLKARIERAQQAESLHRLRENKRREAEAARKKARLLAVEGTRRQAGRRAKSMRRERQQTLESARMDVERMQAGGRLELIVDGHEKVVCELGVWLKSTRKMIFVDQFGRKQMELMPGELAQRIAAGNGRILDFGATFDDTLRSLIVEHSARIPVE